MNPSVLVAGVDSRGLPLEAPILLRERIPLSQVDDPIDLIARAGRDGARLVVLGPAVGAVGAPELARRLRDLAPGFAVSVLVLLPAGTPEELGSACLAAGANAVLRRPLDPFGLENWLAKLLVVPRRVQARLPVQAQVVGTYRATGTSFVGMLRNLSVNGLLLESPVALELGRDLELEFPLPGSLAPAVRLLGRVVRQASEVGWPHLGYGVEFMFGTEDALAAVAEFVARGVVPVRPDVPPDGDSGIHATVRREHWVYEIAQPVARRGAWQVEIRRASRETWRPGSAGPFYVVEGVTPEVALREAREFLRRTPER